MGDKETTVTVVSVGQYISYPSQKAALNAILFTDFLMNLKPKKDE